MLSTLPSKSLFSRTDFLLLLFNGFFIGLSLLLDKSCLFSSLSLSGSLSSFLLLSFSLKLLLQSLLFGNLGSFLLKFSFLRFLGSSGLFTSNFVSLDPSLESLDLLTEFERVRILGQICRFMLDALNLGDNHLLSSRLHRLGPVFSLDRSLLHLKVDIDLLLDGSGHSLQLSKLFCLLVLDGLLSSFLLLLDLLLLGLTFQL